MCLLAFKLIQTIVTQEMPVDEGREDRREGGREGERGGASKMGWVAALIVGSNGLSSILNYYLVAL